MIDWNVHHFRREQDQEENLEHYVLWVHSSSKWHFVGVNVSIEANTDTARARVRKTFWTFDLPGTRLLRRLQEIYWNRSIQIKGLGVTIYRDPVSVWISGRDRYVILRKWHIETGRMSDMLPY